MSSVSDSSYICVRDLSRTIAMAEEKIEILISVRFNIAAGESVAITGESGSGKSTLLGLLAGLDVADSGEIVIDGQDICKMDEDGRAAFRSRYMGFVFQSFQLMPTYTALENVMLPVELSGKWSDSSQLAEASLQRVGLQHRMKHYPHQLSGGEQQRVALARAFVATPKILFADEPTGNLDDKTSDVIIDLMFRLNDESGTTLILVTHEIGLARKCKRRLNLKDGKIEELK